MKHDFEERRQKRIVNAENRALKNEAEADSLYNTAKKMADFIPMGQPILVGHHSEKGDRRYREKIHNTFGKSFEKKNKAKYYADKAESIENNNAIFSDDPEAVNKLKQKLKSLQEAQEFMKSANRYIKQRDKESFLKMPHATEQLWSALTTPDFVGKTGFAAYSLSNNNANMRAIEKRIEQLEKQETNPEVDKAVNGIRIFENREANRLQLIFNSKPDTQIRKLLKSHGFRWSPTEGAWQRHLGNNAMYWAEWIAANIADTGS
jgi:hypothetical protein